MSAPHGERLADVAGVLQAAVTDDRNARRPRGQRRLVDRRDLRDADAGDHSGRTDGAGADTDLDAVHTGVDQGLGTVPGRHIAADDVDAHARLDLRHPVEGIAVVPVRGVDDEEVDARPSQRLGPLQGLRAGTDRRADEQTALGVLRRMGVLLGLDEVLDRDQALEDARVVDQRKLLDLVAAQQLHGVHAGDADLAGDQRHRGHDLAHLARADGLESHVAVGDDAEQLARGVGDRHAADTELGAQGVGLGERGIGVHRDRVGDHSGLGTLDQVDLVHLVLDGQIAVQYAHAALARHGDRHPRLGDLVHRRGEQRDVHPDVPGDTGRGVDSVRKYFRSTRQQQHIVVGQPECREFIGHSVDVGHDTFPKWP